MSDNNPKALDANYLSRAWRRQAAAHRRKVSQKVGRAGGKDRLPRLAQCHQIGQWHHRGPGDDGKVYPLSAFNSGFLQGMLCADEERKKL
jgi:hypothetical protein